MTYLPTISPIEPYARIVASAYGVPVHDITGPMRTARIAAARHVAMWLASVVGGKPAVLIGPYFNRDPSTVSLAIKKVNDTLDVDRKFRAIVERLVTTAGDLCRHGEPRHSCDSCDAPYAHEYSYSHDTNVDI